MEFKFLNFHMREREKKFTRHRPFWIFCLQLFGIVRRYICTILLFHLPLKKEKNNAFLYPKFVSPNNNFYIEHYLIKFKFLNFHIRERERIHKTPFILDILFAALWYSWTVYMYYTFVSSSIGKGKK